MGRVGVETTAGASGEVPVAVGVGVWFIVFTALRMADRSFSETPTACPIADRTCSVTLSKRPVKMPLFRESTVSATAPNPMARLSPAFASWPTITIT